MSRTCPHHPVPFLTGLCPHDTPQYIKGLASPTRSFACRHHRYAVLLKYYIITQYLSPRVASRTLSFASTSALALSSNAHSSVWPLRKAKWSVVVPYCKRIEQVKLCNLHSSLRPLLEARWSDVLPLCNRRKQVAATQAFSILIDFKSYHPGDRDDNGRSKQCLGSRQVTLA